jgi:hypothetical protein
MTTALTHADCLQHGDDCRGKTEYRTPLSGTGRSFARCDYHWDKRLDEQDRITRTYGGDCAPSWFDPTYAGESWDEA